MTVVRTSSHYDFQRAYNDSIYGGSSYALVEFEFRGGDGDTFKFAMGPDAAEDMGKKIIEQLAWAREYEKSLSPDLE